MIKYEEKQIPARTEKIYVDTECDFCGQSVHAHLGNYDVDDVTIVSNYGKQFPGKTYLQNISVDMCGSCFRAKMLPWLTEHMLKGRTPLVEGEKD